jgi:hypothetical protein
MYIYMYQLHVMNLLPYINKITFMLASMSSTKITDQHTTMQKKWKVLLNSWPGIYLDKNKLQVCWLQYIIYY